MIELQINILNNDNFCCGDKKSSKGDGITDNEDPELNQFYYHSDHLGSSSYITNLSGNIVQHIEYVPFGEVFLEEKNNKWNTPYLFNGKELDEETGLYYYGARYYSSRNSIFLSVDPLWEEKPNFSPYNYCSWNPVMRVDPSGAVDNPIYDKNGEFLGTDDKGLQGEAIIMDRKDFTQGMSHEEAMNKGSTLDNMSWDDAFKFANNGNFEKFLNHYNSLSSRPDWDGVVTIKEGIAWAKSHQNLRANPNDVNYSNATPSDALYLDVSKMDFGRLGISDFKEIGVEQGVNLLNSFNGNPRSRFTTYALGRTRMTLHSTALGGIVTVSNGTWNAYDWDYGGKLYRGVLIFGERTLKGLNDTHGFPIQVYGTGLLNK